MRRSVTAAAIAATLLTSSASAQAPMDRVRVGVLECRGGTSIGFVVGSVTNLGCVLRVEGVPEVVKANRPIGLVRSVGSEIGARRSGVVEPTQRPRGRASQSQAFRNC